MPELRKDPILSRWIIVASERAKRPKDFQMPAEKPSNKPCPFCEGNEKTTPPEIFSMRNNDPFP